MMPRYWWVNHSQTFQQEIGGGYLWSPKREANGARSQFYDNIRAANPGDLVLSFADAAITFAGQVSDFAISAPKPEEFSSIGSNWATDGWLLPVVWRPLKRPFHPKNALERIAPLLPLKYSPMSAKTGNGNQKAYLAEIQTSIFHLVIELTGTYELSFPEAAVSSHRSIDFVDRIDRSVERQIEDDPTLANTEKDQLIKARRGQGMFRANVTRVEKACRVTGISNLTLLIASHIRPWRCCTSALERLDGNNGLLLTPHVDLLFDRGLVSFANDGCILVSPRLAFSDLQQLGLSGISGRNTGVFHPEQSSYLDYHRAQIFLC